MRGLRPSTFTTNHDVHAGGALTQVNVDIETRGGLRATFASKDLAPGDVIARIPMAAAIWCAAAGRARRFRRSGQQQARCAARRGAAAPSHSAAGRARACPTLRPPRPAN